MKILINGDSYSASVQNCYSIGHAENSLPWTNVYGDYLRKKLNYDVINLAMPGSSNTRIFRTTTEYILQNSVDIVIVGFSFAHRKEIWYKGKDKRNRLRNEFDNPGHELCFDTLDYYRTQGVDDDIKSMLINKHQNPTLDLINFLTQLIGFSAFCKQHNKKYILFRAAEDPDQKDYNLDYIKNTPIWKSICEDPNILELDFSIPKFARDNNLMTLDTGHLYDDGHEMFANYLQQLLMSR